MNATKSSTPAITSLTSKSDNTNGSTSISEQLAISVANKICEQRTNSNNNSDDDELPTSPTESINTTTNGNKTVNCTRIQNRQIRVVSAEHHSTTTTTPSTNETHKTDEQNSKSNSNCMSSMSSAVADLASGMPNFGSSTNNNNGNNGSSGNNAPIIISGTAAAVLALQNPFNNNNNNDQHTAGNIVSSSGGYDDSVGGGGSGGIVIQSGEGSNNTAVPNPLSILSDMATSTTNSISSPTDQSNNKQFNRQNSNGSNNNLSPSQRSTCYADGAPIISGTAAAQKFQHTSTTTTTTNYNATNIIQNNLLSDDVILAVANINPYDTTSGGGGAVGQPYNNGTISMKSGTNSALFSVNHGTTTYTAGTSTNNNSKTTSLNSDDDIGSIIPDAANIKQSKDLGGMDILAELTCHALPMPTSTSTSIPSYQEIYQEQQQGSGIREGTRQSSIPSYQEIYREMGLSPQSTSQHQQHSSYATEHHQPSNNQQHSRGTTYFGHISNRDELEEGKEIYTRKEIAVCGGHCAENKDVHGNMREGCDSLCLKDCMVRSILYVCIYCVCVCLCASIAILVLVLYGIHPTD